VSDFMPALVLVAVDSNLFHVQTLREVIWSVGFR